MTGAIAYIGGVLSAQASIGAMAKTQCLSAVHNHTSVAGPCGNGYSCAPNRQLYNATAQRMIGTIANIGGVLSAQASIGAFAKTHSLTIVHDCARVCGAQRYGYRNAFGWKLYDAIAERVIGVVANVVRGLGAQPTKFAPTEAHCLIVIEHRAGVRSPSRDGHSLASCWKLHNATTQGGILRRSHSTCGLGAQSTVCA